MFTAIQMQLYNQIKLTDINQGGGAAVGMVSNDPNVAAINLMQQQQ